ncbi:hypothetical protein WJX77_012530 [Trebouxia sp. C0004]
MTVTRGGVFASPFRGVLLDTLCDSEITSVLTVDQSEATIKGALKEGNHPMRAQHPLISFGESDSGDLPPGAMPAKDSTQVTLASSNAHTGVANADA